MIKNIQYSKKIMKLFHNLKNMGRIKNPSGIGKVGNFKCGDIMVIYIKVSKNKKGEEIIKDIKVETTGCVAALVSSSVLTELAKGKTLKEARKITKNYILKKIGEIPIFKIHCSVLAAEALQKAIQDYENKK